MAQSDQQLHALAAAAAKKKLAGQKLSREEERALSRVQQEKDDQLRTLHYRTIPKKDWVAWSGRQHKILAEQERLYGLPLGGKTIDLPAVVRWLHNLLAEKGRRLTDTASGEDVSKRAIDAKREIETEIARRELAELDGNLVSREATRQMWTLAVVTRLRQLGDTLHRAYGPEALDLVNDALSDCERGVRDFCGGDDASPTQ
jgi:hypothetical protein